MLKMPKLLLLTLSLATALLPSKTPLAKKFLGTLQKEINTVAKKVPQGVKQGFKKIGDQLEQKGGKKALQKTEASLLRQTEKQGLETAEKKALEQSNKLLQNPYKNVDHLIESAGKLERKCRGVKQGKIQGNAEHIFKNLAQKHDATIQTLEKGQLHFKSDKLIVTLYQSTSLGEPTLYIEKIIENAGKLCTKKYKIRIRP